MAFTCRSSRGWWNSRTPSATVAHDINTNFTEKDEWRFRGRRHPRTFTLKYRGTVSFYATVVTSWCICASAWQRFEDIRGISLRKRGRYLEGFRGSISAVINPGGKQGSLGFWNILCLWWHFGRRGGGYCGLMLCVAVKTLNSANV